MRDKQNGVKVITMAIAALEAKHTNTSVIIIIA